MFQWLRRRKREKETAARVYAEVVRLARAPDLYATLGLPDTLDGRFDSLVLHVYLLMRRLSRLGPPGEALAQRVFEAMRVDMDETLRELGVGDLSVGKKVRQMAEAFYGRAVAYEEALKAGAEPTALEKALVRNLYRGAEPDSGVTGRLAARVRMLDQAMNGLTLEAIEAAELPREPAPVEAPA